MKPTLLLPCLIAISIVACAQEADDAHLKEVRVLGESKNKLGERIIVRELRIQGKSPQAYTHVGKHFYRFEFYSLGTLYHSITTWDMSEPGKVAFSWDSDDNCEISLMNGWLAVSFERKKTQPWTFARRID